MQLRKHHQRLANRNKHNRVCFGLDQTQKAKEEGSTLTFNNRQERLRFVRGFDQAA